ncbi:GM24711 [Drosophila sechellia]|uniref:GM24711 n=1 Tax=Drosophila sechellia TaxID=7238 RepID=B4INV5_DROSE|nr:GM24711 [Drosophila sechellia]
MSADFQANMMILLAPVIIAGLFPNLNLSYRTSYLSKINTIRSDLLVTLRSSNVSFPAYQAPILH